MIDYAIVKTLHNGGAVQVWQGFADLESAQRQINNITGAMLMGPETSVCTPKATYSILFSGDHIERLNPIERSNAAPYVDLCGQWYKNLDGDYKFRPYVLPGHCRFFMHRDTLGTIRTFDECEARHHSVNELIEVCRTPSGDWRTMTAFELATRDGVVLLGKCYMLIPIIGGYALRNLRTSHIYIIQNTPQAAAYLMRLQILHLV